MIAQNALKDSTCTHILILEQKNVQQVRVLARIVPQKQHVQLVLKVTLLIQKLNANNVTHLAQINVVDLMVKFVMNAILAIISLITTNANLTIHHAQYVGAVQTTIAAHAIQGITQLEQHALNAIHHAQLAPIQTAFVVFHALEATF